VQLINLWKPTIEALNPLLGSYLSSEA